MPIAPCQFQRHASARGFRVEKRRGSPRGFRLGSGIKPHPAFRHPNLQSRPFRASAASCLRGIVPQHWCGAKKQTRFERRLRRYARPAASHRIRPSRASAMWSAHDRALRWPDLFPRPVQKAANQVFVPPPPSPPARDLGPAPCFVRSYHERPSDGPFDAWLVSYLRPFHLQREN